MSRAATWNLTSDQVPAIPAREPFDRINRPNRKQQNENKKHEVCGQGKVEGKTHGPEYFSADGNEQVVHKEHSETVVAQNFEEWHRPVSQLVE